MSNISIELNITAAPELLAAVNAIVAAVKPNSGEPHYMPVATSAPAPAVVPVTPAVETPAPAVPAAPVAPEKAYDFPAIQVAATTLADGGKREEVLALMQRFGTPALSQLKPEQYGAFVTELRGLGAKI